ncbi:hypothetical protein [Marinobacter mangrovi]|uniref:hypothetical protein n=1 Tax=Marinobacter mangrovi TaxID=2803918 RepID=UPI001934388D|nr:hypothetical protein [Marinobacter mangrovi]
MMRQFFVDLESRRDGSHLVHVNGCMLMPERDQCRFLGRHASHKDAVADASTLFSGACACFYCNEDFWDDRSDAIPASIFSHITPLPADVPAGFRHLEPPR